MRHTHLTVVMQNTYRKKNYKQVGVILMHENGPMDDIARNQLRVLRVAVRKQMPIWIIDQTYNKADVNRRIPSD